MKTFKIYTLGCKVNQYETQLMREQLLNSGLKEMHPHTNCNKYGEAPIGVGVNPADLYIINTCTVTSDTDRESRRLTRHCIKENPNAIIIATGCYVEKDADIIKTIDENVMIIPNSDKNNIIKYLPQLTTYNLQLTTNYITHFHGYTKAFIKIQDGCNNFCSFCKVPYVRGAPKSRTKQEILNEAKELIKNNYKEIVLCGICLGAYGIDLNMKDGLTDILKDIQSLEGVFRIRLSSIEMQYVTEELISVMKNSEKICHHLHIPLQSGDDEILKKMNRQYTTDEFMQKIEKLRKEMPGIAISTDVIVGFPGETDEAFENTSKCVEAIRPMRTHIFTYSPRGGTAAYNFKPQINKETAVERYNILKNITDKLAMEYEQQAKRIPQRILVENTRDRKTKKLCGYTDTYVKLVFDGPDEHMGKFSFLDTLTFLRYN